MRAHTTGGVMGTSGGAHPMHRQTFPGEHQKNHQGVFKRPAAANTNTLTKLHTHTHTPLGCRGKGHIRWTKGTKSISLHCVILQHFRLTLQAQGLAFFSTRVPYTHPHACFSVRVSDPIGYRPWGMRCILWNTMSMSGSVSLASDKLLYDTSCVAGRDNRCAACGSLIIVAVYHTSTYSME